MSNDNLQNHNEESSLVVQVYNHYHALALNQHHLINERITQFFLGNTFLLGGFITSSGINKEDIFFPTIVRVRLWLPIVGILLSIIYVVFFIIPSIKSLRQWSTCLEQIEKQYIKKKISNELSSLILPYEAREKSKKWDVYPLYIGFPLLIISFIFLWVIAML